MNTTAPPTHSPSGSTADGLGFYPPPSASLKLQQVHYIVRHGERTPVRTRQIKGIPNRWNFCKSGRQFSAAVLDVTGQGIPSQGRMNVERRVEGSDHNDQVVKGQDGECLLGELTDVGRASTLRIGKELRSLYIDQLGLLPQKLLPSDENKVYFRSTNMSRTVESLQQIVRGLLPQTQIDGDQFVPKILIRNGTNENLLPNTFGCARLRNLDRAFADFAAKIHNPSLEPLDSKLAPICGGAVPRVDGHPRLNGILDTVKAASAHGIKVDPVFTEPQIAETLEKAVCAEWFSGYQAEDPEKRLEFRRLAMSRLLEDLNTRMTTKARFEETDPLRLAVYSAHDTSLAGLLSTLDCFDNRWPSFTASVGIELWKDTRPEAQPSILDKFGYMLGISSAETPHYVRMRYGDKTLRLPACSKPGRHLEGNQEFCTLDAFREIVHGLRHPKGLNWEQQCDVGRGEKSSK